MEVAPAAVVFDLDGTLLNTLEDLADSMNAALAAAGHPVHPVGAYRFFVGDGMASLVRRALPQGGRSAAAVAAATARMRAEYDRRWADKTRPYPGIPELLDGLAARGLRLAVLSNKPDDFARATVERLLARWRFDAVQGLRPEVPRKPDPTAARAIAAALQLAPARCVYVGDSSTDMVTARRAGMFAVGATWGFRDREELVAAGAQAIAASPADVMDLV